MDKELQLRDHGLGDIAKVALVEDILSTSMEADGWYSNMPHKDRHLKRYFPACRFNPNASLLMIARPGSWSRSVRPCGVATRKQYLLSSGAVNKVLTILMDGHSVLWPSVVVDMRIMDIDGLRLHFCGGTMAFVPWFTALFGALPGTKSVVTSVKSVKLLLLSTQTKNRAALRRRTATTTARTFASRTHWPTRC